MMYLALIFPILMIVLCISLLTLSTVVFIKTSVKDKKSIWKLTTVALLIILIPTFYIGYRFLKPQFDIAREGNQLINESNALISEIEGIENAVEVSIGEFKFDPSDNKVFDGEILNEKGGIPVTLNNTENYAVLCTVRVIAYDKFGNEIAFESAGTDGQLEAGETKTFWLFRGWIKESDIKKYKSATFEEDRDKRITTKIFE